MANYSVIEGNKVINTIVADSAEIAAMLTEKEVVEVSEFGPWIDWTRIDNNWVEPRPYSSWILNNQYKWEAPIVKPNDDKTYSWNENNLSWVEVTE